MFSFEARTPPPRDEPELTKMDLPTARDVVAGVASLMYPARDGEGRPLTAAMPHSVKTDQKNAAPEPRYQKTSGGAVLEQRSEQSAPSSSGVETTPPMAAAILTSTQVLHRFCVLPKKVMSSPDTTVGLHNTLHQHDT